MTAKPKGIRAVFLDLDGTMVDSIPDIHLALNQMRADLSLAPLDEEKTKHFVGRGTESLVRSALAMDCDDDAVNARLPQALVFFRRHYLETNGCCSRVYPDVMEGLRQFREQGLSLACVTNKPAIFTDPLLAKTGLYPLLDAISSADSVPRKKPDPLPMQVLSARFGLHPSEVLVIGDSINDVRAARSAGCSVFVVPYGYNHGQSVRDMDADGVIPRITDALCLISGIGAV
ncbi:MAG: phosphoglycolate phosphatase [Burkholderiaceae bacterium]|nr:phosphoglycolate phosphatase [Burkholderiaceae bacterium]